MVTWQHGQPAARPSRLCTPWEAGNRGDGGIEELTERRKAFGGGADFGLGGQERCDGGIDLRVLDIDGWVGAAGHDLILNFHVEMCLKGEAGWRAWRGSSTGKRDSVEGTGLGEVERRRAGERGERLA